MRKTPEGRSVRQAARSSSGASRRNRCESASIRIGLSQPEAATGHATTHVPHSPPRPAACHHARAPLPAPPRVMPPPTRPTPRPAPRPAPPSHAPAKHTPRPRTPHRRIATPAPRSQGVSAEAAAAAERLLLRRDMAVRGVAYLASAADAAGIRTPGDVGAVHRMQRAFPYRVPGLSKRFGFCARPAGELDAGQRRACAEHFLWLLLRRSANQARRGNGGRG